MHFDAAQHPYFSPVQLQSNAPLCKLTKSALRCSTSEMLSGHKSLTISISKMREHPSQICPGVQKPWGIYMMTRVLNVIVLNRKIIFRVTHSPRLGDDVVDSDHEVGACQNFQEPFHHGVLSPQPHFPVVAECKSSTLR